MTDIDLHPIKVETFDLEGRFNIDPKGNERPVESYALRDGALYMGRQADHQDFDYLESWLLPAHNVRISRFHFREGFKPTQELYVDIALIHHENNADGGEVWTTRDLYVDLVSHTDGHWDLLDLDELGAAIEEGYLRASEVATALITTQSAVDGIASQGFDGWVQSLGVELNWPVWDARRKSS